MALKFPSYRVKTIQFYLLCRTFEASFQAATSSHRHMRAGMAQGGLISSILFSLNVNDIPVPSRRVELALGGRHGRHSHVSQASAACQLPEILLRRIRALAQEMEDCYQRVEEHGDALHTQANPISSASCSLR
jgi:hypothetical protein